MRRAILHCDLNNFYASVEAVRNPELKGKAIAVCGSTEERHGIVLAKSEKAKKCGVKTGDTVWQAQQKCRDIIIVPPHFEQYVTYGRAAREIYYCYTDLIEPFGLDECWLDVSASQSLFGSDYEIAYKIKERIKKELGLTISVGVSFNKVFAKLGSDLKKPDGITVIRENNFKDKLWKLPASDLLFVGRSTNKKLASYGIHTIGELARTEPKLLCDMFGKNGYALWRSANGYENSAVSSFFSTPEVKSIGRGVTLTSDLETDRDVWAVIFNLSGNVSVHLRRQKLAAGGIQLTVKSNDLKCVQFQEKMPFITQNAREIADRAYAIYLERYDKILPVRALTVRAIDLFDESTAQQLNLFFDIELHQRREILEKTVLEINTHYGKNTVQPAILMGDLKFPTGKTDEVVLPSARFR